MKARSKTAATGTPKQHGSGRGNGIAPVTPPTPPDMRSSASGGWAQRRLGHREIGWDIESSFKIAARMGHFGDAEA